MSEAASRSRGIRVVVIVATIILLTRIPALWLSRGGFLFNVDELELVRSVVDRFIGVPSTSLAWPASLLQMFGVVAVAIGALFAPVTSTGAFADYLSRLYLDSSGLLALLRITTTVVMTAGFAFYFVRLRESGKGNLFSVGTTLVFATTPLGVIYSTQAVGDGLAFSLLLLSGLWLEGAASSRREVVAGTLFGLALAAKFTAVLALPLILALVLVPGAREKGAMQRTLAFAFASGLALLVACPYLWLDPTRLAKSLLGNAGRVGETMGFAGALWEMLVAISAPMAVLAVVGLARLAYRRRFGVATGGALSLLILLVITANAGVVYDRYFLPGLAVAGLVGLHAPWPRRPDRIDAAFLTVGTVIFGFANGLGYLVALDERLEAGRDRQAAFEELASLPEGTRLLVPLHVLVENPAVASSESLLRVADGVDRAMLAGASREALAGKAGMTKDAARMLLPAFSEDELSLAARLRAMAGTTPRRGLDFHPWYHDGARFGIATEEEARATYRANRAQHLMTRLNDGDCTDFLYLGREGKRIGDSCLYFPGEGRRGEEAAPD